MGIVFYLLGATSLRHLADYEGFFKSMLFRFFPPYQMWFVVTHWAETQDYFAFFASGLIIVAIGLGVITTSPAAKKAEASEREYQSVLDEFVRGKGPSKSPPPLTKTAERSE